MDTIFLNTFSEEIWTENYRDTNDNTVDESFMRVAKSMSSVEINEKKRKEWEDNFYDMLSDFKATAGGRIYANAGTDWKGVTLINCFTGPKPKKDQDSIEGILETLLFQTKTLKSEGGWGMNFSFIRPRNSFIYGIGVESPGSVKYMELFDKSSDIITAGSGRKSDNKKAKKKIRKGAMMGVLDVWHPDIEEFVKAKQSGEKLTKFNISVNCSNVFMNKVIKIKELEEQKAKEEEIKKYDDWDLIFPETRFEKYKEEWDGDVKSWTDMGYPIITYKTISVRYLWNLIIKSTYNRAEPGILFCDIANKTHTWYYGGKKSYISYSNPCGEQVMPPGSICDLGSLNLVKMLNKDKSGFDIKKIEKYTKYLVRFLDNVNDYTKTPLKEYDEAIRRRRIGLGILGWGSTLYLLKIRFASDKAEKIKEELMKTICYSAIEASIDLAEEKGMFDGCDPQKHAESEFFKQIDCPKYLLDKMKKFGIRNSSLFSIQPTGGTGIFANMVSGGCEPVFSPNYIRTTIVPQIPEEIKDVCPNFYSGEFFETSMFKFEKEGDETILKGKDKNGTMYKIDKSRGLTKEVECKDYGYKILEELGEWDKNADWAVTSSELNVEDHLRDLKGFAKYLDASASKTISVPNNYPFYKFENVYLDAYKTGYIKGVTTYRVGTMANVLSSEEQSKQTAIKNQATKRPKSLSCDIHHVKVTKRLDKVRTFEYLVIVGSLNDKPYEIFACENGQLDKKYIKGQIIKLERGKYDLVLEDDTKIHNITKETSEMEDVVTRMVSLNLRHGIDISFIVQQLEKSGDIGSFNKAIVRALKKYIKDGVVVTGETCPNCKSENLVRSEGCVKCQDCGNSKCG